MVLSRVTAIDLPEKVILVLKMALNFPLIDWLIKNLISNPQ